MKASIILSTLVLFLVSLQTLSQTSFKVAVTGKGDPVLLFPGFGCTGELWDDTVVELSKTNECHVFTFAGFGTVAPIPSPWLETIKNEILTYVKSKQLNQATLIGHSLGGTLSMWLASEESDLFKKVIAVDALPSTAALMIPNYDGTPLPFDNPQSTMMLQMDATAFHNMNAQQVAFMCQNKEKQALINSWLDQADRQTYVNGFVELLNLDLRKAIGNIKIPVVILAATNPSLEVVQKTYKEQFEHLPSVTIHYAEDAFHFVMYDQPEWFLNQIRNEF